MNFKQKIVLAIGTILFLLMILYPPFNAHSKSLHPTQFYGYGFLFDPPLINEYWFLKVNYQRLINQWIIVLIPTLLLIWALKDNRQ